MTASTTKNNLLNAVRNLTVLLISLGVWQLLSYAVDNTYFLPGVPDTFHALIRLAGTEKFIVSILTSLLRVALGLVFGILFGVLLGTFSHLLPVVHTLVSPIISVMKATPIATVILILWFTFTDATLAIFVVFLMVTPIIWQNVYDGYRSIPKELREVCDVYQFTLSKRIRLLIFPAVVKYLIPAVITSIGLAWKAEIAAEIMTYSNIGRSIQDFKTLSYDTSSVFAWAVVIITLSIILEKLTKLLLGRIKT